MTLARDANDPQLNHIVMCADHASIDAKSINLISAELLELLAGDTFPATEPVQLAPPALKDRLPTNPRQGRRRYETAIPLPAQRIGGLLHQTRLVSRRLDRQTTTALKAGITANRTTLHGALAAACVLAEHDKFGVDDVTMLSTVDLRRFCRPAMPADVFGCYIDILRPPIRSHPTSGGWPASCRSG